MPLFQVVIVGEYPLDWIPQNGYVPASNGKATLTSQHFSRLLHVLVGVSYLQPEGMNVQKPWGR